MIYFLNFKLLNVFKFQIDIETNAAFTIIVNLWYLICQISKNFNKIIS
jgi:hypothetical protein